MLKKFKINFSNWLTWLNVVAVICVMTTVGTAYDSADDFVTKAFAFISFWWVFFILFYIFENSDELKVKELLAEIKKRDDEWSEIKDDLNDDWTPEKDDNDENIDVDKVLEKMYKIDEEREERENQFEYVLPHELEK